MPDVEIDPTAVMWSAPADERAARPLLVLLHGYGADERDLWGLVPHLPEAFVVASVRAPFAAPWPAPGYSWYPIDALATRDPAGVTAAGASLLAWLDDEAADAASIGVLGFSQGASVAIQAMRLNPSRLAFAINLSGYAAPGDLEHDAALSTLRPPVFWGRGTNDDVIPPALVAHTTMWLPEHVELSGRVYQGLTHSISEAELADVRAFLDARVAAS